LPDLASRLPEIEEVGGTTIAYFTARDERDLAKEMDCSSMTNRAGADGKEAQMRVTDSTVDGCRAYEALYRKWSTVADGP